VALCLLAAILGLPPTAVAQSSRPATVPALARWHGASGAFDLRPDARVVVRLDDRVRMRREAAQLADDLAALVGQSVAVKASRHARARDGDLVIRGARGRVLGGRRREGYALRIDGTFSILAASRAGAFYGGRTLLQLVRGGEPIPRGRARDWPRYRERGLMVDNGRKFFSRRWLERRIVELAGLKLNLLHLHLSDNEGFRIESDSHPEAVTPPFLSKRDVRRLVAVAERHHVTLVPEIDAPGHMRAALRAHPELQLADADGRLEADKLDVTDPRARRFVFDLIDELAPLFPGSYWHTGGDEYLGPFATDADYLRYPQLERYADAEYGPQANGKDAVLDFLNAVGERVREHGKRLRQWSDGVGGGAAVRTDPRSSVMWWEEGHSPSPEDLVAAGHQVINAGWWPTYYVTGGPLEVLRTPVEQMYEGWQPWSFSGPYSARWVLGPAAPAAATLAPDDPGLLGASLQVWNDVPDAPGAEQAAVATGIAPRLRVLAQKTWGSPELTPSYAEFAARTAAAAG
jgi:hexosaminidase